MVRAQDDVPQAQSHSHSHSQQQHQFVDPAMLKLLHKTESLFELDEIVWDSPPDTPSSVSSDEELFANRDLKSEWDALFHDPSEPPKADPLSASNSSAPSSAASPTSVMWNFELPMSHLDIEPELFHGSHHLLHTSSSSSSSSASALSSASSSGPAPASMSLAAVMASACASSSTSSSSSSSSSSAHSHMHAMPDLDFEHGLELDVFGLDSGSVPPPPPPTPVAAPAPSVPSTPSLAKSAVHKSHHVPRAIVFDKKKSSVDKRKSEDDSMEAKKARARQTRDEIVAKTQAALRQGCKAENPEMRRITHNVLERKRREDLKVSYQELRSFVPEVMHNDRAPTGQILGKAVDYIHALRAEEHELMQKIAAMRQENERLRNRMC